MTVKTNKKENIRELIGDIKMRDIKNRKIKSYNKSDHLFLNQRSKRWISLVERISFSIFLALLLMLFIPRNSLSAGLGMQVLKYEPAPVAPGDVFEIWILLKNYGENTIENATVKIEDSFPFSLERGEKRAQSFSLPSNGEAIANFKIKVARGVREGSRSLKIKFSQGDNIWVERDYKISIQSHQNLISLSKIEIQPQTIVPGDQIRIKLGLKNIGSATIKDISIALILYDETEKGKLDLPFIPEKDSATKRINFIEPGEEKEIAFNLRVSPDAPILAYKIPIRIQYYDEMGNAKVVNDLIGIPLSDISNVEILLDSEKELKAGEINEVQFKVINKGLGEIKFATAEITPTSEIEIVSSPKDYLGNIDSDDYETATFKIKPKFSEGYVVLPVKVRYRDFMNKEVSIEKNFQMNIIKENKTSLMSPAWLIAALIIILICIGAALHRRKRKRLEE